MKKIYFILGMLLLGSSAMFGQDPCASITSVSCGNPITFIQSGAGSTFFENSFQGDSNCYGGNGQGGKEQIYSFSVTTTGTYEITVTSAAGGTVQYMYKDASLSCDNTGWTCINRNSGTGSIGSPNFQAGHTYYILLNSETAASVTQIFQINCVRVVCDNIQPVVCGNPTTFGPISGFGDFYIDNSFQGDSNCYGGNGQGGKEQIYSFSVTTTGTYEITVTSAAGGTVQYMYKDASLSCDNTGWTCINRNSGTGSIGSPNFQAGHTYYILLNSETTASVTQIFQINCVRVVCDNIQPVVCGNPTTFGPISGFGDFYIDNSFQGASNCYGGNGQGGKEQIYSFSVTTTGTYEITVTSAAGGTVQYMYKDASLSCDNTGWTCINRNSGTGSIGSPNFQAGHTYYILLNSETAASVTQIFQINCVRVVCDNIQPVVCGNPTTFGPISGFGDFYIDNSFQGTSNCYGGNGQGGKEQIYLLPASSSQYQIQIEAASGSVQYLWKNANLGCGSTGWNCIGRFSSETNIPASNLSTIPLNTPIYLLLNSESLNSVNHVFSVACDPLSNLEFNILNNVTISPNPTTGTITFKNLPTSSSMTYEVYNSLGQTIMSGQLKNQSLKIDGQNGVYTLKIKDGKNEMTRKIILKK